MNRLLRCPCGSAFPGGLIRVYPRLDSAALPQLARGLDELFDLLFELRAGQHDRVAAGEALDANVHAGAHSVCRSPAGIDTCTQWWLCVRQV